MLKILVILMILAIPVLGIADDEYITIDEDIKATETPSNSSTNEITVYWGDNTSIGPYIISIASFSKGTHREKSDECDSDKFTQEQKTVFFGCDDYVILKVLREKQEWDTILSDHNTTINGADIENIAVYEDGDYKLTIKAEKVATGYNIPTPYVNLSIKLENISKQTKPSPPINIEKIIPEWTYLNQTKGIIRVSLEVENLKNTDVHNIQLTDEIPDCFILKEGFLKYNFELKPKQKWHADYILKQVNCTTKEYEFPKAIANLTYIGYSYNISSNSPVLEIYGSNITINKSVNKQNEIYTVSVKLENKGNRASKIFVKDEIPNNTKLIDGKLNFSVILKPDEKYTNTYNISGNTKSLPPAIAEFHDYSDLRNGTVKSNEIEIKEIKTISQTKKTPKDNISTKNNITHNTSNESIINRIIRFLKNIVFITTNHKIYNT